MYSSRLREIVNKLVEPLKASPINRYAALVISLLSITVSTFAISA